MPVAAMRRRDFVSYFKGFADPHGNRFFARIHVGQPWHFCRQIQLVGIVFESPDSNHLTVHAQKILGIVLGRVLVGFFGFAGAHFQFLVSCLGPAAASASRVFQGGAQ